MEGFDLDELTGHEQMGIGRSRCALAYREKMRVFTSLIEMAECFGQEYMDDAAGTGFLIGEPDAAMMMDQGHPEAGTTSPRSSRHMHRQEPQPPARKKRNGVKKTETK